MGASEPNGTIAWRVAALERRVERLYDLEPALVAARVNDLHQDMDELKDELKGVRRALWGFGLSVAGGAVVFALTVYQLVG